MLFLLLWLMWNDYLDARTWQGENTFLSKRYHVSCFSLFKVYMVELFYLLDKIKKIYIYIYIKHLKNLIVASTTLSRLRGI